MSTMISFRDNNISEKFLTNDEVKRLCPSAFKTAPTNPDVSEKYTYANTATVINDLEKLGWRPVQAKQCRKKEGSKGIRSFHMIAFQNPDVKIVEKNDDGSETIDSYPRILLTNSHDGFNSFKFMVGLYRLVCSNGLVVCDKEFENMSIRHINYDFETLRKVVVKAIEKIPGIICTMNAMKNTEVKEEEKRKIAIEMLKIRKGLDLNATLEVDDTTISDILTPLRPEDDRNNLWSVFNICQEKMMNGLFSLKGKNSKFRKQRRITSIKKDVEYNQRLWDYASKYVTVDA